MNGDRKNGKGNTTVLIFAVFSFVIGGVVAAGVPVVLHLLMRGKPKKYEFPALRFLQRIHKVNTRNFRLKHLLLLLLRVSMFVLLGAALAGPVFQCVDTSRSSGENTAAANTVRTSGHRRSLDAPVAAAIVMDTSVRMEYQWENRTRLDCAKQLALQLIRRLPAESTVAVFGGRGSVRGNGFAAEGAAGRMETFQIDQYSAARRIEKLETDCAAPPVFRLVLDAVRLVQDSPLPDKEIYVFSDMTRPGWPETMAQSIQTVRTDWEKSHPAEPPLRVYITDVGVSQPQDVAIDRLRFSSQVLSANNPIRIEADLTHSGAAEKRMAELVLNHTADQSADRDGNVQNRGTETVEFGTDERAKSVTFHLSGFSPGLYQGYVRLTTGDALPWGDIAPFTFEVQSSWRVLLVTPDNTTTAVTTTSARTSTSLSSSIPNSFTENYFRQALDPTPLRKTGVSPFQTEVVSLTELEKMPPQEVEKYRAIFLLDPPVVSQSLWKKLGDFVAAGNGVGLFLGRNLQDIQPFVQPFAVDVIGAKVVRQARRPDGVFLHVSDYSHPILSGFADGTTDGELQLNTISIPWDALPVFRYWETSQLAENTMVMARYTDGRSAVLLHPLGQGYVVTMTTPVSDNPNMAGNDLPWNLLPVGDGSEAVWVFVALCDGIGRFLIGASDQSYNYRIGQTARLTFSGDKLPDTLILTLPDGQTTKLPPDSQKRGLQISSTEQIGNYRTSSGGDTAGRESGFSVYFRSGQFDLTHTDVAVLDTAFGEDEYQLLEQSIDFLQDGTRKRTQRDLFPWIVAVLCTFFALETMLANRFY